MNTGFQDKEELRARVCAARAALSADERRRQAHEACGLARRLIEESAVSRGAMVGVYCALRDELCLDELIAWLYSRGMRVVFPCAHGAAAMSFYEVSRETWQARTLPFLARPGKFCAAADTGCGIPVSPRDIDLLLVPGAAFDSAGRRLGLGGGCYDSYLPRLRPDCKVWGVAFSEQVVERVPTEAHDCKVQALITPPRKGA